MDHIELEHRNEPHDDRTIETGGTNRPRHLKGAILGVIEQRVLLRDCLTHCLGEISALEVMGVATPEEWLDCCRDLDIFLVLLSLSGCPTREHNKTSIRRLAQARPDIPVVVLSEGESLDQIISVFKEGARGYIPTSLNLALALDAMRLVKAGGVYLPQSSLAAARQAERPQNAPSDPNPLSEVFTDRQLEVLEALRRGKANKIIAYELDMCESTVKVHIRNIMRKLKATNRTEVAYKANEILGSAGPRMAASRASGKAQVHI
jgi:DNA-binding NarL/FixJ family response regulator